MKNLPILLFLFTILASCSENQNTESKFSYKELADSGYSKANAGNLHDAQLIALELISKDTAKPAGYYILGVCQKENNQYKEAILNFSKAIAIDTSFYAYYYFRAQCYLAQKVQDSAFFDLYAAMQIANDLEEKEIIGSLMVENYSQEYSEELSMKLQNVRVEFSKNQKGEIDGKWSAYYPSGQLYKERIYADGLKNGYDRRYYENDQIHFEQFYKDDILNGPYISYHRNGQISTKGMLVNGQWEGIKRSWYESGKNESEVHMKNGKHHGLVTFWLEDGKVLTQGNYINGQVDGDVVVWNDDLRKHFIETYKNGQFIFKREKNN